MSLTKEFKKKEFDSIWLKYPNKDSRKRSEINFNKSVKTYDHIKQIDQALINYLNMLKTETWRKCQSGCTWFNNWQDWTAYKPETISQVKYVPLTPTEREQVIYSFGDECQNNIRVKLSTCWHKVKSRIKLNHAPVNLW